MEQISKAGLEEIKFDIEETIKDLNLEAKASRLGELETRSMEEDFWKDTNAAKKVMSEIESIRKEQEAAKAMLSTITTILELFQTIPENDREELLPDYDKLKKDFLEFQKLKFLSGKYDKAGAILSIHAGQGGTEANDWVEMLLRMYTRYCERKGWPKSITHMVQGTEAGISTVTLEITGDYAFGLLKREKGVHRLVRLSPFNASNLRQTSFAGVEVIPVIEEDDNEIIIPNTDIEFKAVRSGGPGGQNVNKTSSAVQIKHIPTGISVHCSQERSQEQNRQTAMRILKAKLWHLEEEKRKEELQKIKGAYKVAGWGNQIRNYVLHPYKLVKDLRTEIESSNPDNVLDGDLDLFIDAEIRIQYDV